MKEKIEKGVMGVASRHLLRSMRMGMQRSVVRPIVELITNSDDSYIRMEEKGKLEGKGVIEVVYRKEVGRGFFAVRDYAEGMSIEKVRKSFKKYGEATSGLRDGGGVRGYFGQGAKDALTLMTDGKICTFKDDMYVECRLYREDNVPTYEIHGPYEVTPKLRRKHKIDGNGTVACFQADRKTVRNLPRFAKLHEKLANSWLIRKIMINPRRKVILLGKNGEKRLLKKHLPKGEPILSDDFKITYGNYGTFPVSISIWRSDEPLDQSKGDDREGGLLLVDEKDTVLSISLFKYDNEPLARHLFGEVRIDRFRELLIGETEEEAVLSPTRDGLAERHPFCESLIEEIERRLEKVVKDEKLRKQKEAQSKIDLEEAARYRKAFNILNEIAEEETQTAINLGQKPTDKIEIPPDGFCLDPTQAEITVGKRYNFKLRIDTNVIRHGSLIKITCSSGGIRVITPEVRVVREEGSDIITKHITIQGTEANVKGVLKASTGYKMCEASIFVIPEKELLFAEGMVFQPETLTLRPNRSRRISLLVYVKMIKGGSEIKIYSDNESIKLSKESIMVNEFDAKKNVATYELEAWGEGVGQRALIAAEFETYMACCEVRIKAKEEEEEKRRKGMFNEPKYDHSANPFQRTSYSEETGQVIIYVNFPSVKHYIGDSEQYRKTLPAQVFIADLIAEQCFHAIAMKKVETTDAALIDPHFKADEIQRRTNELSSKYGKKVHEALVNQALLEEAEVESGGEESS